MNSAVVAVLMEYVPHTQPLTFPNLQPSQKNCSHNQHRLFYVVTVVAGAGGEEGVGLVGGSFSSFTASLWIGSDGWLFGGLILEWPPPWIVTLLFCLFVYVIVQPEIHVWCLPELVVVGNCSPCINRHVRGHQPRSGRRCQIKSHLCLVYSQLVALQALGQVWLVDSVLQQCEKLALRFFRPASITKNAVAHINLCPEHAVHEGLDWLIQTWEPCLREPVRLVRHKPIELPIGALPVSDESKNVPFILPGPALVCKTLNRRVWQRGWQIGPLPKQPRASVIVNDINVTQACPDEWPSPAPMNAKETQGA